MFVKKLTALFCLVVSISLASCADGGDTSGSGGTSGSSANLKLVLTSSTLSSSSIVTDLDLFTLGSRYIDTVMAAVTGTITTNSCSINLGSGPTNGQCLTPINMSGYASIVTLGAANSAGVRILGGSTEPDLGANGVIEVDAYDLSAASTLTGEDNVQDDTNDTSWTELSVSFASTDVKLKIGDEYWTVRYAFIDQPILDNSYFSNCITDEGYRSGITTNGRFISDMDFKRNDVLLCVKSNATDTCAATDFQWLDISNTSSPSLVSTRPTTPFTYDVTSETGTGYTDGVKCEANSDGQGYDTDLGGFTMRATLVDSSAASTSFKLSAAFNNSCLKTYTYTDATGTVTTGNNPTVTVTYGFNDGIFIDTSAIETAASVGDWKTADKGFILQHIHPKSIYARKNLGPNDYTSVDTGFTATVGVAFGDELDESTCTSEDSSDTTSSRI